MNADILLSAQDLSVRFGGVLAVNKVSFDVKRGEVFTLIGPNGAGKTTVFNLISRIYTPTTGVIDYAGPQGTLRLTDQRGEPPVLRQRRRARQRHGDLTGNTGVNAGRNGASGCSTKRLQTSDSGD